jgi:glutathione S-transferase
LLSFIIRFLTIYSGIDMRYHLIMGNQAYSSWSLRGWLLLRAFSIDFEHEVIPLYVPEYDDFLSRHYPAATVPTLVVGEGDNALRIWDSLAIAEYLHEQHPRAGIWPADPAARATARSLCAEMHSSYQALRSTMPMNVRREYHSFEADALARANIDRIVDLWQWASANWGGSGPYLFGEHFCAVDAFYAPVASRFRTYNIALQSASQRYADALLAHPATREFYAAGLLESWVMEQNEFDCD